MVENQVKQRVIDNPTAGETYVNRVIGTSFDGAAIGVVLGCQRVMPSQVDTTPGQPEVHVVSRLTLTPAAAADLAKGLNGILAAIAKGASKPN